MQIGIVGCLGPTPTGIGAAVGPSGVCECHVLMYSPIESDPVMSANLTGWVGEFGVRARQRANHRVNDQTDDISESARPTVR